ncbi:MAG: ribbon-helix-helix protein, CopG family [Acidobacteriaceae bacterium]
MASAPTKRVNVIFSDDQYKSLESLASKQEISISDALRQAIKISTLVVDANEDKDAKILFEKNGKIQELKLVR